MAAVRYLTNGFVFLSSELTSVCFLIYQRNAVSDGQRRRVQIMLGLLRPFKVLLIDEFTVDLDVLCRRDLLAYLQKETETRKCTILYCTVS